MRMRGHIFGLWLAVSVPLAAAPAKVTFNRDIRAILSENCYKCHGPDAKARKAKLRLDVRDEALKERKGGVFPIVPGNVAESELVTRILSNDPDELMPPADSKLSITVTQKETLKQWVTQGAKYEPHWAYVRPVRHALPQVKEPKRVRNAIDNFIFAELEKRNWQASVEANRHAIIRRVSLDLTGLPPTPAEI